MSDSAKHVSRYRQSVPRYPEINSAVEFIRLRTSTNHDDYERSAWASMPVAVWWELLHYHPAMRFWLAHNRTTPLQILAELGRDADARVRYRVALKRACPAVILDQLCKDLDESVRSAARRNRARKAPPGG
jgi:hypothetical protein